LAREKERKGNSSPLSLLFARRQTSPGQTCRCLANAATSLEKRILSVLETRGRKKVDRPGLQFPPSVERREGESVWDHRPEGGGESGEIPTIRKRKKETATALVHGWRGRGWERDGQPAEKKCSPCALIRSFPLREGEGKTTTPPHQRKKNGGEEGLASENSKGKVNLSNNRAGMSHLKGEGREKQKAAHLELTPLNRNTPGRIVRDRTTSHLFDLKAWKKR